MWGHPRQRSLETRVYGIDNLVITHPHDDHLADIQRIHDDVTDQGHIQFQTNVFAALRAKICAPYGAGGCRAVDHDR